MSTRRPEKAFSVRPEPRRSLMPAPGAGVDAAFLYPDEAQLTWRRPTHFPGARGGGVPHPLARTPAGGISMGPGFEARLAASSGRVRDAVHASLASLGIELDESGPSRPSSPSLGADEVGASVQLVEPGETLGLTVRLALERSTAVAIVQTALGRTPDSACLDEFLKELANLAGGALKRLLRQGIAMGLPSPLTSVPASPASRVRRSMPDVTAPGPAPAPGMRDVEFRLHSVHGPMRCTISVRTATRAELAPGELREGQVTVRDVRGPDGAVLASAGVRLTRAGVRRLQESLDRAARVEVVDDE